MTEGNIFEIYRRQEKAAGRNLTQLLEALNERHGTGYQHGRWAQWESGGRRPTLEVYEDLVQRVLITLLQEAGMDRKRASAIARQCALPAPTTEVAST